MLLRWIKCELLAFNGDGNLLEPISRSITSEIIIPTPTPGAPIKSLENIEEGEIIMEILGETEAICCDDAFVVIPADMESTI